MKLLDWTSSGGEDSSHTTTEHQSCAWNKCLHQIKSWPHELRGIWLKILCNNQSVVSVLNTGRARDFKLQQLLREVMWVQALHNFEMQAEYITTKENRTADILSRAHLGGGEIHAAP